MSKLKLKSCGCSALFALIPILLLLILFGVDMSVSDSDIAPFALCHNDTDITSSITTDSGYEIATTAEIVLKNAKAMTVSKISFNIMSDNGFEEDIEVKVLKKLQTTQEELAVNIYRMTEPAHAVSFDLTERLSNGFYQDNAWIELSAYQSSYIVIRIDCTSNINLQGMTIAYNTTN